jgi:UDP-2,3-diacylglucosamine pyrophosphatase LpxH
LADKRRYRTVFLSDLHLGTRGCQAQDLARLLKRLRCDKLYLVGDVIDMWRLRKRWYWTAAHNDVVRRVLKIARKHEVIFIPGNHDEAARQFFHLEFGGVRVKPFDVHTTADGRQLFVTHGDQFDLIVKHSRLLSMLGSAAYDWLIRLNVVYNRGRSLVGLKYWSLSKFLKLKVKKACTYISRFEDTLVHEARRRKLDGVVCGHIHQAEQRDYDGVTYFNCGDWVESCTLLVEHQDGRIELLDGLTLLEELRLGEAADGVDADPDTHEPTLDDFDLDEHEPDPHHAHAAVDLLAHLERDLITADR